MLESWRTSSWTSPQRNLFTAAAIQMLSPVMRRLAPDDDEQSKHTVYILTILSLVFASISVVSTLSTLYWFVKMRRSFRHELILLLVQSDFVKSAAFVVFPIVSLYKGPVESDSAFCQASGFVLTVGVESSDIAILLIALHSVMYIFRPQSGLYPYRHLAYSAFYLFPLAAACLAFINGNGFENVGHYCYLRTDNNWSRLALSWVPRYFICVSIIGIYAFIYIYIRKRMDDYGRRSSGSLPQDGPSTTPPPEFPPPPLMIPRISYHGLIPSTPSSRRTSATDTITAAKGRQRSISSLSTAKLDNTNRMPGQPFPSGATLFLSGRSPLSRPARPIQWTWGGFNQASSGSSNFSADEFSDPLSTGPAPTAPSHLGLSPPPPVAGQTASTPPRRSQSHVIISDASPGRSGTTNLEGNSPNNPPTQPSPRASFFNRSVVPSRCPTHSNGEDANGQPCRRRMFSSLPNILAMLRRGPSGLGSAARETLNTNESPVHFNPSAFDHDSSDVSRNREKIKRQLWSLFVYPLVYMIIWVFPFVSHVMGYDDQVLRNDPQWLLVLGILSLSVQGMVDCLLFTVREQPWRHAGGRGFFDLLWKRIAWAEWASFFRGEGSRMAGRTREEVLVDGRLARARRKEEVAQERSRRTMGLGRSGAGDLSGGATANATATGTLVPQRRREWWDVDLAWVDEREEAYLDVDGYEDIDEEQQPSSYGETRQQRLSTRQRSFQDDIGLETTTGSGTGSGSRRSRSHY